jgi:lipopolysaccharide biosynthesis glycosyltransferase/tetratricopeptide (TPR) repeat protein
MKESASPLQTAQIKSVIHRIGALRSPSQIVAAVETARQELGEHNYLRFLAGRASADQGNFDAALAHLQVSLTLSADFGWAHYEVARVLQKLGRTDEAADYLHNFLEGHSQTLNKPQLAVCEAVVDRLFQGDRRSVATALYRRIVDLGSRRSLTVVRVMESALDRQDTDTADRLSVFLGEPADAWAHLAMARLRALHRQDAQAGEHLRQAQVMAPTQADVALVSAHLLRRLNDGAGDKLLVGALMPGWQQSLPAEDVELLRMMVQRLLPESERRALNLGLALESRRAQKWPFIEYLYEHPAYLGDGLEAALLGRFAHDADIYMCLANVEVSQRRFESARQLSLCGLDAAVTTAQRQAFEFKLFEIECFCKRLESARDLLAVIDFHALDDVQKTAVVRFHAEAGDWPEAARLLEPLWSKAAALVLVDDQIDFALRAAQKTQAHARWLDALAARARPWEPAVDRLVHVLYEDHAARAADPAAAAALGLDLGIKATPMLRFKLGLRDAAAFAPLLARQGRRRAFFHCADQAYLLPALVSLHSLLEANEVLSDAHFYLVVDKPQMPLAEAALEKLASHYNAMVLATAAQQLSMPTERLGAGYGIFTGGHQLAASAYYRIYMARWLAASGDYDSLLYVDADTLVGPGFEDLFELKPSPLALLMARLEIDRPEVREAIAAHGLPPGRYFNSGLLYFPRIGTDLLSALDAACHHAEQRPGSLLFQDQCALNIAFRDTFEVLPERFNYFVGPRDGPKLEQATQAEVCMVHLLDRPKPWQSAYPSGSSVQRRWRLSAAGLCRVIGDELMRELLALTLPV